MGLLPRSSTVRRSQSRVDRKLQHEPLEGRQLLAANIFYVADLETGAPISEEQTVGPFAVVQDADENDALSDGDILSFVSVGGPDRVVYGVDAFGSIQAAIDAAPVGEQVAIVIAPGKYDGNVDATGEGKQITFKVGGDAVNLVEINGDLTLDENDTLVARAMSSEMRDWFDISGALSLGDASLEIDTSKLLGGETVLRAADLVVVEYGELDGEFGNTSPTISSTPSRPRNDHLTGTAWSVDYAALGGTSITIDNAAPVILSGDLYHEITDEGADTVSLSGTFTYAGPGFEHTAFVLQSRSTPAFGSFTFGLSSSDKVTSEVPWTFTVKRSSIQHLLNPSSEGGASARQLFSFSVQDETAPSKSDVVTLTFAIFGKNDAPEAGELQRSVLETGELVDIKLPFTDVDHNDSHTFEILTNDLDGELVVDDATGTFTYRPAGNYNYLNVGESFVGSFTFKVTDAAGESSEGVVTISIDGVNTAPVAEAAEASTDEKTDLLLTRDDFNFDDVDSDLDKIRIELGSKDGLQGTIEVLEDGTFRYSPNGKFDDLRAGDEPVYEKFEYFVYDDATAKSNAATMTIAIHGVNDQPVVEDEELEILENAEEPATISLSVLDPDNESHTFAPKDDWSTLGGIATLTEDGQFSFSPGEDFLTLREGEPSSPLVFEYLVTDEDGGTSTGKVIVTVIGVNNEPLAKDLHWVISEDEVKSDLLGFDDADVGDEYQFEFVGPEELADAVQIDPATGEITFTPGDRYTWLSEGAEFPLELTYRVSDGLASSTGTIFITIVGKNNSPVAESASFDIDEDGSVENEQLKVTDADSEDFHRFTLNPGFVLNPNEGVAMMSSSEPQWIVSLTEEGFFSFDPNGEFEHLPKDATAELQFTYTATDILGESSTGIITVIIKGLNSDPTVPEQLFTVDEDSDGESGVAIAEDIDGDALEFSLAPENATIGSVTMNPDGTFTYSPNGKFEHLAQDGEPGSDEIIFLAKDPHGAVIQGTIPIRITGQNDAPAFGELEGPLHVLDNGLLTHHVQATDPDQGSVLTYQVVRDGTQGTVSIDPSTGQLTYDPAGKFDDLATGATATDSFKVIVGDGHTSVEKIFTVTITGSDKSPSAVDDSYVTATNTTLSIPAVFGLLSNDSGFRGQAIHIASVGYGDASYPVGKAIPLAHGMIVVASDGSFSYMPRMYEGGQDTFTYAVTDGTYTSTATVTISIAGLNNPPIAIADYQITDQDTPVVVDVLFNDFDPDFDILQLRRVNGYDVVDGARMLNDQILTTFGGGTVSILVEDGRSKLQYTPNVNYVGVDQFSYLITDGRGGYAGAEVYVRVGGTIAPPPPPPAGNRDPFAVDDFYSIGNKSVLALGVLANDSDPDTPAQSLRIESVIAGGETYTYSEGGDVTKIAFPGMGDLTFVSDVNDTNFNFLPAEGAVGEIEFTYTITDGNGGTATATVKINITGSNTAPVAVDDIYAWDGDGFAFSSEEGHGLLDNDSDLDEDELTATLLSQPKDAEGNSAGFVSLLADGSFTFIPVPGFRGEATFSYRVIDVHGGNSTAAVTIKVGDDIDPGEDDDEGGNDDGGEGEGPAGEGPKLVNLFVSSSQWNADFRDYVYFGETDKDGTGVGYAIPGGESQLLSLPWMNLDEIILEFNEEISASLEDGEFENWLSESELSPIQNPLGPVTILDVTVEGVFVKLKLSNGIGVSQVNLQIDPSRFVDEGGNPWDSSWVDEARNEGSFGGLAIAEGPSPFEFTFYVVPGDANGDRDFAPSRGTGDEESDLISRGTTGIGNRPSEDGVNPHKVFSVKVADIPDGDDWYSPYRDFNGDGWQNNVDRFDIEKFYEVKEE